MATLVKICGVTLPDDAARVASSGAHFLGFNFWPRSKRYLAPERAEQMAAIARSSGPVQLVGVFVDPDLEDVMRIHGEIRLDAIQLHGDESPELCRQLGAAAKVPIWKAISVASARDVEPLQVWPVDAILLDAPTPGRGGAGAKFDHELAREARRRHPARRIVLAGGLDASTVAAAIALVEPWAVDVASGVEVAPGIKDAAKLAAFVAAATAGAMRAALALLAACAAAEPAPVRNVAPPVPPQVPACTGECLPVASFVDRTGHVHGAAELRDRIVVVTFFATWARPSYAQLDALVRAARDPRIAVFAILTNEVDDADLVRFFAAHPVPYPIVQGSQALMTAFGYPELIPMTFVYDRRGAQVAKRTGLVDEGALAAILAPLLQSR